VRVVTLTQLEAFVLVARLGSVKAAAGVLGVTEPAVSSALAALRQHLGDQLVVRSAHGMELTPGGQRLVGIASQMVNLGADAVAAIRRAQGEPDLLHVVATSTIAEFMAPPLIELFTARTAAVEATVGVSGTIEMPALLQDRLADVAFGPRLAGAGIESTPMMRHKLVVVAGKRHPLAGATDVSPESLSKSNWMVDPAGTEPSSEVGQLLTRFGVPERRRRVFSGAAAVWSAVAEGNDIAPVLAHLVAREVQDGRLVVLPVRGTPVDVLWYVSTLEVSRRAPAATKLRQFLTTPDAMHVMHRADGSVPVSRFRPPVYVTLWS
jgi:LysR family transcriptional regulator, low CO2-responsive transcriptional regulator